MSTEQIHPKRNGVQILIAWANDQDHWVRAIAGEVLATRRELPEKSIAAAYSMLLAEKGLSSGTAPNVSLLSERIAPAEDAADLRLLRLSNLSGVNALATGQEIAFNHRLTVLFGENAAGKTGYVRVLKRLASVRSAQPILGNVHTSTASTPRATIEYSLSGATQTIEWNDETGVPPFTRISVFDSSIVSLHVDDDLTYVYTPGELALFLYVHRAIEAVKAHLEREKNEAEPKATNPFLHRFPRDPIVYPKIETLGAATSLLDIQALANIAAEEEVALPSLRDNVEALKQPSADRLQVATADRDLYRAAHNAAQLAASFPWEKYNSAIDDVRKAEERHIAASNTAFSGENIPALFGEAWKEFIIAGEAYLRETGAPTTPRPGDRCPYCQQDLSAKALALVQKYREFCNNELKNSLDVAIASVKHLAGPLTTLQITSLNESCERRRATFTDPSVIPPLLSETIAFLAQFARRHTEVSAARTVDETDSMRDAASVLMHGTAEAVLRFEQTITDLRMQADERKKQLDAESAKLRLLENRLTLRALLSEVRSYVERAQWAGRAAPLIGRITSVLRALTEQSKIASKELLDQDFKRLFEVECEMLRAPTVQLDFAGRKGQAARKKTLVPDHRLSEILSEGEQKVIALADFLAEAGLHRTTAPIVFDDPVNSLDYKRLQYLVDRVVRLSVTRQIIVFTHNIWFATELLSRFEKTPADCAYFGVSEAEGNFGIVSRGSHPRWDSVNKLTGKINQLIQSAGSATGEVQTALVESAYGEIRSWCEVVVEQELLAGVTQRYQPNVAMTKLPQIKVERFAAARDVVFPLFEKACRVMTAHSQPLETLAIRPTLAELRRDWSAAQQARSAYVTDDLSPPKTTRGLGTQGPVTPSQPLRPLQQPSTGKQLFTTPTRSDDPTR